ncbi:MAG TPA: R3H domain-containing nucleic acid-binding protein [Solirubrobacteraceae bacterium]|jgi:spoIIIJ-associated protein|nr:R3H domain-containing nucleic acid-binding protein [Solirubrobacteraceae bacterium]
MAEVSADTPEARVRELLEEVVDALDLDAEIQVSDDGEVVTGTLVGEDLGLVIGRHGQTIDALQHLAWRIAVRESDERRRVVIDAAGYRDRRAAALQAQADQAVADALRFSRPVALDAMTASDRKVVHEYLRDRGDVETYSEGDEPDRHLVVAPLRP